MPSVEPIPQMRLRSFLAGAISGAVSRTTVAPLERIQCLMNTQTHREFRFSRDFVDSVRAIWKQDHLRGFWRGNLVNVLRIAPSMSITFGVFEEAKRALARLEGVSIKDLSPGDRFVAGAMAGLSSMTVTYPFEVVQVRMMATINVRDTAQGSSTPIFRQGKAMEPPVSSPTYPMSPKSNFPSSASQVRSVNTGAGQATNAFFGSPRLHSRPVLSTSLILETVRSMWREGGVKRFYRGLVPSMLGIVPYAGLNLMTYETLKQAYLSRIRDPSSTSPASPSPFALLGIGVVATATGASVTYPLSAVRQRLQAQGTVSHPQMYAGMRDVFVRTFRNEGIKGFYRGLPASLAKALPSASISYVIYEVAKDALGVPKGE
ncbi:mitochondrial carrier [Gonapodya prolifera JEL478]|uniref:Mitochondrial carrier n=1 Tax=Gonapodya prolifera (strain JEL478) TaxID=1344416 RepID=A0A139AWH8_GONPJ|nr:mitochondrial carrier [Gonapodya prolifera JEL478]|eukprot:KXS21059.1 mitochondrial carrier [Gonapodya prolifera JEL478]